MQSPPDWQEILQYFRGSELQNYFTRILEDDLTATVKPQYVDNIPKAVRYGLSDCCCFLNYQYLGASNGDCLLEDGFAATVEN